MAKEIQDTVGEVEDMPVIDSETEQAERTSGALGLVAGSNQEAPGDFSETNFEGEGEGDADAEAEAPEDAMLEASADEQDDAEHAAVVSAPPSLALWLSDELRPSPSKSKPPIAAATVDQPETLAPVALPPAELSDEDLAVLPAGARPGGSRSSARYGVLALLGAAVAVFLFSYVRSPSTTPQVHTEPAAQPVPHDAVDRGTAAPPARVDDAAPPTETTADEPAARRLSHGRWVAPTPEEQEALEEERRRLGPSVGRFPDLPAEYWSELRRREQEGRAERERELSTDPSTDPSLDDAFAP